MCDTSTSSSNQSVVTDQLMQDLAYNFAQQAHAHGTDSNAIGYDANIIAVR
jgi:hypothetical protein